MNLPAPNPKRMDSPRELRMATNCIPPCFIKFRSAVKRLLDPYCLAMV